MVLRILYYFTQAFCMFFFFGFSFYHSFFYSFYNILTFSFSFCLLFQHFIYSFLFLNSHAWAPCTTSTSRDWTRLYFKSHERHMITSFLTRFDDQININRNWVGRSGNHCSILSYDSIQRINPKMTRRKKEQEFSVSKIITILKT